MEISHNNINVGGDLLKNIGPTGEAYVCEYTGMLLADIPNGTDPKAYTGHIRVKQPGSKPYHKPIVILYPEGVGSTPYWREGYLTDRQPREWNSFGKLRVVDEIKRIFKVK
jgi:hypothetical protein